MFVNHFVEAVMEVYDMENEIEAMYTHVLRNTPSPQLHHLPSCSSPELAERHCGSHRYAQLVYFLPFTTTLLLMEFMNLW